VVHIDRDDIKSMVGEFTRGYNMDFAINLFCVAGGVGFAVIISRVLLIIGLKIMEKR